MKPWVERLSITAMVTTLLGLIGWGLPVYVDERFERAMALHELQISEDLRLARSEQAETAKRLERLIAQLEAVEANQDRVVVLLSNIVGAEMQ